MSDFQIEWSWSDQDMDDFPHLTEKTIRFSVLRSLVEIPQDLVWRISTEIYSRTGIVVPNELSVASHVRNWETIKSMV